VPDLVLDAPELETCLPHRGVNLLPDRVTVTADGSLAVSHTRVGTGDPRGRDLFARRTGAGERVWLEPFLGELLAVTGAPLLRSRLDGNREVAVLSSVAHVAFHGEARLEGELEARARIVRARGPFALFASELRCDGRFVCEAEVLSGVASLADLGKREPRPPGPGPGAALQADFGFKDPALRFVDSVREWEPASRRLVASYRYPEDHPLVPGHFPGVPLMMGMTQWLAVADAAWEARARLGHAGGLEVDGCLSRPDGTRVLEVRALVLDSDGGLPRFVTARRVAFHEPVRPGDGILVEARVKPR
jgi:3-hydroxymyristoyl/3-hydroxydecanoyl-(acyl carrier protein) dehydratase